MAYDRNAEARLRRAAESWRSDEPRQRLIEAALAYMATGVTLTRAAEVAGMKKSNLHRLLKNAPKAETE